MATANRRRLLMGAILIVGLAGWFGWRYWSGGVPVDVETVGSRTIESVVRHEGRTRVRDRFVVSAPLAGRLLRIELEPGDAVRAGETVVATFLPADPNPLDVRTRAQADARIKAAQADLERSLAEQARSEAALDLSRHELQRAVELFDKGIVSRQQMEYFETDERAATQATRSAQASVQAARFELEVARSALVAVSREDSGTATPHEFRLTSPIDGTILRRMRESEGVVAAGEPLLEIADLRNLEIVADFLSADAVKIQTGMDARILRWGGPDALAATVRRVNPAGFTKISALGVEEQRVDVILDLADSDGAGALGDEFRVEVEVVIERHGDVLAVPSAALFRRGGGWATFVVESRTVRARQVVPGLRGELWVEVVDGLTGGQAVVVHPPDSLADGARVNERSRSASSP